MTPGQKALDLGLGQQPLQKAGRDDEVRIVITVIEIEPEAARVKLSCEGFVNGALIMDGVAVVRVPRRRKPSAR